MTTTPTLAWNRYGKSCVRVMKLRRSPSGDALRELTVDIALEGDFESAHTQGDNAAVLPTDTMKNTVYALAQQDPIETIESFALRLARHFLSAAPSASTARIDIAETAWRPLDVPGDSRHHAFSRSADETPTCSAEAPRGKPESVRSGLRNLVILKTARSGFSHFLRDQFTTLKETDDRLLGTSLTATWPLRSAQEDFAQARAQVRSALLEAFAAHDSKSVQHTLFAMAQRALAACPAAPEITLTMPNKHCLLVDLSPFGLTNDNEIFLPIDEPHGLIEATLRR